MAQRSGCGSGRVCSNGRSPTSRVLADLLGRVVFVTYDQPSAELDRLRARVAPIQVLANDRGWPYRVFGLLGPVLHRRALRACHVLKTNQLSGSWAAVLAKRLTHRPLIVRSGYVWSRFAVLGGEGRLRIWARRSAEALALRHADAVLVATQDDRRYLQRMFGIRDALVSIVPNSVDTDRFAPGHDRKTPGSVVFVGRLAPQKNVDMLIEAVARTRGARLDIIGAGDLETTLRETAAGKPVSFRGVVPNYSLPGVLRRAEVLALPSAYEGAPKALLEGMACGLAVVGTRVPGTSEVLQDGVNGLCCAPTVEDLSRALEQALGDAALRARLGRQARESMLARHTLDAVVRMESQLIRRLASGDSGGRLTRLGTRDDV